MNTVHNLVKRYGDTTVESDVSLRVQPSEITAYLGPNRAGKSITVKMIIGLLRPTEGWVPICGHDIAIDL